MVNTLLSIYILFLLKFWSTAINKSVNIRWWFFHYMKDFHNSLTFILFFYLVLKFFLHILQHSNELVVSGIIYVILLTYSCTVFMYIIDLIIFFKYICDLPVYLSTCPLVCLSTFIPVYLFCLFTYPLVHLWIFLSVYLSTCLLFY